MSDQPSTPVLTTPPAHPAIDVTVVSSAHDIADARLHRSVAALLRAGLSVEVAGPGEAHSGPPGATVTALGARGGLLGRIVRDLALPFRARGRVLVTVDPDLTPVAAVACLLRRRRFAVDVHDDYLHLLRNGLWSGGPRRFLAACGVRLCTFIARRAHLTVVTDERLPPLTARNRLVVRNIPDLGYLPTPGPAVGAPRAVYIGDVRRSRGLAAMLCALEGAPDWELDIVGPVDPADRSWLRAWLHSSCAAPRVRVHGRLAPEKAWRFAQGAWVGLALLDDTPDFREAVPVKLYEYLGCGLAVVATPLPRMARLVDESGAGCLVDGPAHAAGVLDAWSRRPEEMHTHREAARAWARRHLSGTLPADELARAVGELVRSTHLEAPAPGRIGTEPGPTGT